MDLQGQGYAVGDCSSDHVTSARSLQYWQVNDLKDANPWNAMPTQDTSWKVTGSDPGIAQNLEIIALVHCLVLRLIHLYIM